MGGGGGGGAGFENSMTPARNPGQTETDTQPKEGAGSCEIKHTKPKI